MRQELDRARPTLIVTDLEGVSNGEQVMVKHILAAAELVERIYARQRGAARLSAQRVEDPASSALMHRNQGPWCEQTGLAEDADCSALADRPPRISGLYPADLQEDENFCDALGAHKDAEALLDPFTVVQRDASGELKAVPYSKAYEAEMLALRREVQAAAGALPDDEEAFRAYLTALANSMETNDWKPADEAWAKMNAKNSRWYLRLGPDETYFEPCDRKAGFHVSFARINPDSLAWQERLDPVKGDMEREVARLAGPPYRARDVSFQLPDFIDIVLNAGDSRSATGATIGQSLPNWGPVANEGRGRTVAMTNLGTDPDSLASQQSVAASLFCADTAPMIDGDPEPGLISTVLHEAAHNLGPSHDYRAGGRTSDEAFGGPLASTMEELKAQTAALHLTDWLASRELLDADLARRSHVYDMQWAMGHIARGMYEDGQPRTYSQLAAIQVGLLMEAGALSWNAEQSAANGTDKGCMSVNLDAFPAAAEAMARTVFAAKARNDKPAALALVARHVDGDGPAVALHPVIAERVMRSPIASYVYAVRD